MKQFICALLLLCFLESSGQDTFSVPADAETFYNKAIPAINSKYRKLIDQTAAQLRNKDVRADSVTQLLQRSGMVANLQAADIDALVVLVMMQASKSAQEDLKAVMMEMKKKNAEKKTMRQTPVTKQRQIADSLTGSQSKLNNKTTVYNAPVDSSQLLQMRMDTIITRRSGTNNAISSLMKKISDTQNQIIQNLK